MYVNLPRIEIRGNKIVISDEELGKVSAIIYKCALRDNFEKMVDYYERLMPDDCFCVLLPEGLLYSLRILSLAILYTYKILSKHKSKIKKPSLLLLSILLCKKQVSEVIDIVTRYSGIKKYVYTIIVCRDKTIPAQTGLNSCRDADFLEIDINALKEIYGISMDTLEDIEDYISTKITGHIVKNYY